MAWIFSGVDGIVGVMSTAVSYVYMIFKNALVCVCVCVCEREREGGRILHLAVIIIVKIIASVALKEGFGLGFRVRNRIKVRVRVSSTPPILVHHHLYYLSNRVDIQQKKFTYHIELDKCLDCCGGLALQFSARQVKLSSTYVLPIA